MLAAMNSTEGRRLCFPEPRRDHSRLARRVYAQCAAETVEWSGVTLPVCQAQLTDASPSVPDSRVGAVSGSGSSAGRQAQMTWEQAQYRICHRVVGSISLWACFGPW